MQLLCRSNMVYKNFYAFKCVMLNDIGYSANVHDMKMQNEE